MFEFVQVSPSRARVVIDEIEQGSEPHFRFYAMLIASSMIACFGLAANSTAVVIGAMLVSPLMTPIFGVALGMLQGNPHLIWRAGRAEAGGAMLAVASASVVGLFELTSGEATSEMLARTAPNLIDLLVAVFAGFAGAYALVDERISPALPGVAIATAIVPPLATGGLCLALGAWGGAGGALLLFLANFVAILVVALITFAVTGLARPRHVSSWRGMARHFGPTAAAFFCIAVILTNSLLHIRRERSVRHEIHNALLRELSRVHAADLEEFIHTTAKDHVQVLATVRSPRVLSPARVTSIQNAIQDSLDQPVDLVVRTVLARDVSPTGSQLRVRAADLDGSFLAQRTSGLEASESLAEQVIRERFQSEPGFEITNVEYGKGSRGQGIVLAYINALRRITRSEILDLQRVLRERFEDMDLQFLVRVNAAKLEFGTGPVLVDWTSHHGASTSEINSLPQTEKLIRATVVECADVIPVHVHFNLKDERTRVLVEVVGPNPVTPQEAELIQQRVSEQLESPTEIHLWYRNEFVVNSDGYTTYEELSDPDLASRSDMLREIFQTVPASTGDEP